MTLRDAQGKEEVGEAHSVAGIIRLAELDGDLGQELQPATPCELTQAAQHQEAENIGDQQADRK